MITREPIHLIVNADDYGYFPCVSQGILEAAYSGSLTATGILATSPDLATRLAELDTVENLDVGVHLNLTFGRPMTAHMAEKLAHWQGYFPSAYAMSIMILTNKLSIQDVSREWCAQIEACQARKLIFLNSHEHIHMLPVLFSLTLELAQAYQIPYVRLTRAEWLGWLPIASLLRNVVIQTFQMTNQHRCKTQTPLFLGLSCSGKLNDNYLERVFSSLLPGLSYELMCHPGRVVPHEIKMSTLLDYHDWEGELALLQNPKTHALYERFGIRLSRYRYEERTL